MVARLTANRDIEGHRTKVILLEHACHVDRISVDSE